MKQLLKYKSKKKLLEKEFKMLQRWGVCYVTNKIDSPSTQWHSQTLWFWGCTAWTGNHFLVSECTLVLTLICYIVTEHQTYRRLSECKDTVNYTLPLRSSSSWRFFWADYEPAVFVLGTYTQLPCQEEQEHSHAEDGTLKSVDAFKILTTKMNADQG